MNPWLLLSLAILLELSGTICLKLSQGFTLLLPSVGVVCFYFKHYLLLFADKANVIAASEGRGGKYVGYCNPDKPIFILNVCDTYAEILVEDKKFYIKNVDWGSFKEIVDEAF